ncbi:MAG TPA: hypothetical protein PKZ16_02110 [bacterium]|nr:hypothetical protein [bacterium]HPL95627.1 hypothetical protein [bacterium]
MVNKQKDPLTIWHIIKNRKPEWREFHYLIAINRTGELWLCPRPNLTGKKEKFSGNFTNRSTTFNKHNFFDLLVKLL